MTISNDRRKRRLPTPSCGHPTCQYHRFPPHVANIMLQRMYARILVASFSVEEWRESWDIIDGMG